MYAVFLLALIALNGYGFYKSFKNKEWVWCGITACLTLWCAYDFVNRIR